MPGEIKIPGLGEVKKGYVYAGGIFIVGAVVFVYIRRKNAASSAASTASTATGTATVTDPAGNVCAALDPASGYCPGTTEDEQYQEQMSSGLGDTGVGYDEYPGGGAGQYEIQDSEGNFCTELDPSTGLCPVGSGTTSTGTTTVTTNAQWVVEAEEQLGNSTTVQAALGYALSGSPVTAAQKNLFMEAVGLLGDPPQGYPPLNVTTPGTSPGGSGTTSVTVPNVNGEYVETQAVPKLTAAGLTYRTSQPIDPKYRWKVFSQTPGAGQKVAKGGRVDLGVEKVA